jgi:hypothetical protein
MDEGFAQSSWVFIRSFAVPSDGGRRLDINRQAGNLVR